MTSLVRPILSSILCCFIACGHAPAWLHVATCDGHSHTQVSGPDLTAASSCSFGCHHHHDDKPTVVADDGVQIDGDGATHDEHHSENCFVCQSLAGPCGVVPEIGILLAVGLVSQSSAVSVERLVVSASLSIAHPRGPPVVA